MTRRRSDAGFSLVVLIFFATAASILLTAAIPAYQMQARREREEELIFRGEEYMRAIQKYQKRFGIYPPSLDALQQANGLRFIRRLYTDPTSDKPFRLIYLNPDGSLTGSIVFSQRVVNAPGSGTTPLGSTPLSASTPSVGATPQRNASASGATPPLNAASPFGGTPPSSAASPFGGTPPSSAASPSGGAPPPNASSLSGGTPPLSTASPSGATPSRNGAPSAASPAARPTTQSGTNQTFGTSGIIGVASDTEQTSIKVYRGREKYNEWEFIAISGQPGTTPLGAMPPPGVTSSGATPPPGATPSFGITPPPGATPSFGMTPPSGATPSFGVTPPPGSTPNTGKAPPFKQ